MNNSAPHGPGSGPAAHTSTSSSIAGHDWALCIDPQLLLNSLRSAYSQSDRHFVAACVSQLDVDPGNFPGSSVQDFRCSLRGDHGFENNDVELDDRSYWQTHSEFANQALMHSNGIITTDTYQDSTLVNQNEPQCNNLRHACSSAMVGHTATSRSTRTHKHYVCDSINCGKTFRYPKDLKRHYKTHVRGEPLYCPYVDCEWTIKGFQRKDNLKRHLRKIHKKSAKCSDYHD